SDESRFLRLAALRGLRERQRLSQQTTENILDKLKLGGDVQLTFLALPNAGPVAQTGAQQSGQNAENRHSNQNFQQGESRLTASADHRRSGSGSDSGSGEAFGWTRRSVVSVTTPPPELLSPHSTVTATR